VPPPCESFLHCTRSNVYGAKSICLPALSNAPFLREDFFVCRKRQLEEDRAFYQDQKKAASLIANGSLVEIIENTLDRLE
jgi:hypothetical protein